MNWKELTLTDIERLVEAIEQAGDNPDAVKAIIDRAPERSSPHGRVTVDSLLQLLAQTRGSTVLPDAIVEWLHQPEPAVAPVQPATPVPPAVPIGGIIYQITVNYNQSFAAMVAAGRYTYVHGHIKAMHFPVQATGPKNIAAILLEYNQDMFDQDVLNDLPAKGLRPATIAEFLAFGAAYPDEPRNFFIFALGSSETEADGFRYVPYLQRTAAGARALSIYKSFPVVWNTSRHILAVYKQGG